MWGTAKCHASHTFKIEDSDVCIWVTMSSQRATEDMNGSQWRLGSWPLALVMDCLVITTNQP